MKTELIIKAEVACAVVFMTMAFASAHGAMSEVARFDSVGPVTFLCDEPGGWKADFRKERSADGADELAVALSSPVESAPPKFSLRFELPQNGVHFLWHSAAETPALPPAWHRGFTATLARGMPLMALLDENDSSHLVFSVSESVLAVRMSAGLQETNSTILCGVHFSEEPTAKMKSYSVKLRIDGRRQRWDDAVRGSSAWIAGAGGYEPMAVPETARDPYYSTWYSFGQRITAAAIEDEARRAAALGMKAIIVDDGWQTDERGRAYERCGDMKVSAVKFPDGMAAHVRRVHETGLRYVLWVTVSMMGYKNAEYERFKGKFLKHQESVHCAILDPRFPEVREYLASMYERMMKEWGLDGFKFDYVGQFSLGVRPDGAPEIDPAIAENFAGRDTKSIGEAVDWLMTDTMKRLRAVKPEVIIEYRQPYVSPGIRRYGNLIRACDCPGEMQKNLIRTSMLRLTSGETAVHSDMLEWNLGETPESAAKQILVSLFSTIQYSVMLSRLPESHTRMLKHWLDFTQFHRETLLKGRFTARHPEANYPVIESESAEERVIGVYLADHSAAVKLDRPTVVVNGTGTGSLVLEFDRPGKAVVKNTFGEVIRRVDVAVGFNRMAVPVAGYLELAE